MFISFPPQVATSISDVTVPRLELATSSSAVSSSSKVEVHFSAILTDSVTIKQTEPNLQKHAHLCCYCYARPPDHLILDCRKSHHLYLVAGKVTDRSVASCLQVSLFCLLVSSVLWLISLSFLPTDCWNETIISICSSPLLSPGPRNIII
jgi:hypothetical protein